jgi:drug/metabolite transporter (DMT)-like permease
VGAVTMAILGIVTGLSMRVSTGDVSFRDSTVPWFAPVLALGLVTAALAYLTGIGGVRRLGARLAAFVGLCEVLAAVLFAWLLLAQVPTTTQLIGGLLVLTGVALVQAGEPTRPVS